MARVPTVPTRWHRKAEAQHFLHAERIANEGADGHRDGHSPERHPADVPEMVALKSKDLPHAGSTSCRITKENAEATRAMQLATNNRRGFMRRNSGANRSPPTREEAFGLAE